MANQLLTLAGGAALPSDLMWRQIGELAKEKPVVVTMGDVAASGGYYMSMAAPLVLAHPLTITGSIGVVNGKFNLEELYKKVRCCSLSTGAHRNELTLSTGCYMLSPVCHGNEHALSTVCRCQ
jgi:ClpP class serine protease